MDLLTQSDRNLLRSELKNVTDTFHKTPIIINIKQQRIDIHSEDSAVFETVVPYNLMCYAQFDFILNNLTTSGTIEKFDVAVDLNIDIVIASGLCDNSENLKFSTGKDTFVINGVSYILRDYSTEGHFEQKGIIVKLLGEKMVKTTNG